VTIEYTPLTIMTWNLQGSQRPDITKVADKIQQFQPNIIAIQEIQKHQARALARRLEWSYVWAFKHNGYGPLLPRRAEGMAIMSRLPLSNTGRTTLSSGYGRYTYRRRIAMWADINLNAQAITLVNTHLASDAVGDEGSNQARTLRTLIDGWQQRHQQQQHVLIAGDFNDHQRPDIVNILNAENNHDAWTHSTSRSRNGLTNPTKTPYQRLDHILVPHTSAVEYVEVPDTNNDWATLSDHLPVIATINLA
jgi:endonuclease/exonuclease/phosphatase family metal-dependent hydrolase